LAGEEKATLLPEAAPAIALTVNDANPFGAFSAVEVG
jgi:hypothetical protein